MLVRIFDNCYQIPDSDKCYYGDKFCSESITYITSFLETFELI